MLCSFLFFSFSFFPPLFSFSFLFYFNKGEKKSNVLVPMYTFFFFCPSWYLCSSRVTFSCLLWLSGSYWLVCLDPSLIHYWAVWDSSLCLSSDWLAPLHLSSLLVTNSLLFCSPLVDLYIRRCTLMANLHTHTHTHTHTELNLYIVSQIEFVLVWLIHFSNMLIYTASLILCSPVGWGCRICKNCISVEEVRPPPIFTMSILDITVNHLMVRLQP